MPRLCTFPGKIGDLLWALPTVRAIAAEEGPVSLMVAPGCGGLRELLEKQPYIHEVIVCETWEVRDTAPITPWGPPIQAWENYYGVWHLGYRKWPSDRLPFFVKQQTEEIYGMDHGGSWNLEPWIKVEGVQPSETISIGFSDEWFELKVGLVELLGRGRARVLCGPGSRWQTEGGAIPLGWEATAHCIARSALFVGCLSSMAVLAAALGKPRILVEPNPQRHHAIFQHWDQELLKGSDGLPTFDSRHLVDEVKRRLGEVHA